MSEVVRFSVSLEGELLEAFDRYCSRRQVATRSEAIRQLRAKTDHGRLANDAATSPPA